MSLVLAGCGDSGRPAPGAVPTVTTAASSASPAATATTGAGPNGGGSRAAPGPSGAIWPTYQGDAQRLGVAPPGQPPLTPLHRVWSATLDRSAVYGQPLLAGGRVLVATEDDHLYALDPLDATVEWTITLGTPLRHVTANAGCGDIDPLGITSTPVVDPSTGTVYAVGEVSTGGGLPVRHVMAAVDIATGRLVETVDVDPPLAKGENPVHLLQRAALAEGNGRVYISYGGQFGDCGTYHGWVVSVPTIPHATGLGAARDERVFDVTPHSTGGGIWDSGNGPSIGPDGSVYVTTGNPDSAGPAPWAEAVVELPPGLGPTPEAVYQDRAATGDEDLATGGAEVLPDGSVFVAGKTDTGYVLRRSDLAPRAPIRGTICGSNPDGGAAFDAALDRLYLPCNRGGLQEVDLSSGTAGWRSGSVNSTPILVGGYLWALSYPAGAIEEIDPVSGRILYRAGAGRAVPNFAAPSAAGGLLLVPTTTGVEAFAGPQGPPGPVPPGRG